MSLDALSYERTDYNAIQKEIGAGETSRIDALENKAIFVQDYDAVGDGVTDDTEDLNTAIASNRTIYLGDNATYKISSPLSVTSNTKIIGGANTKIDATGLADNVFEIEGGLGTPVILEQDALVKATTVYCVPNVSVDDYIKIYSEKALLDDIGAGEICRVKTVGADNITLYSPLTDSYLVSDSAYVVKINFIENVTIENVSIDASNTLELIKGVYAEYGKNIKVINCNFNRTHYVGVAFKDCVQSQVINSKITNLLYTGLAYGVAIWGASADILISGNNFENMRHAVTTGGSSAFYGLGDRILVSHNTASNMWAASFDTHGGCKGITFANNIVYGGSEYGIRMRSGNVRLLNNDIYYTKASSIHIVIGDEIPLNMIIKGNNIFGSTTYGIDVELNSGDVEAGIITIEGNIINKSTSHGIAFTKALGSDYKGVTIRNNIILDPEGHGIYLRDLDNPILQNNIIRYTAGNSTDQGINVYQGVGGIFENNVVDGFDAFFSFYDLTGIILNKNHSFNNDDFILTSGTVSYSIMDEDNLKTGTLASPPATIQANEIWMDTTDSATNPTLRIKQ